MGNPLGKPSTPPVPAKKSRIVRKNLKKAMRAQHVLTCSTVLDDELLPCLETLYEHCGVLDGAAIKMLLNLGVQDEEFRSWNLLAATLQEDDPDYARIHTLVANSKYKFMNVKLKSILRIIPRARDLQKVEVPFHELPENKHKFKMMLWHGTRAECVPGILKDGLKLPFHEGFFGKGIYFAEALAKSSGYTDWRWGEENSNYFFLCEVILGTTFETERYGSRLSWTVPPTGYESVKCNGRQIVDPRGNETVEGTVWPLGHVIEPEAASARWAEYSEYVVYETERVLPKYLVEVIYLYG